MSDRELTPEEENTWRALKDQDPLMPLRCRFGFHRWTIWKFVTINKENYERSPRLHYNISPVLYSSVCTECNRKKYKTRKEPRVAYPNE